MLVENEYRVIGPPGCLAGETIIQVHRNGATRKYRIDYLVDRLETAVPGGFFRGNGYGRKATTKWDSSVKTMVRSEVGGLIRLMPVIAAMRSGSRPIYSLTLKSGDKISLTQDHLVLTDDGYVAAGLLNGRRVAVASKPVACGKPKKKSYKYREGLRYHPLAGRKSQGRYSVAVHRLAYEAMRNCVDLEKWIDMHKSPGLPEGLFYLSQEEVIHHIDDNHNNNSPSNLRLCKNPAEHSLLHAEQGRWADVIAKIDFIAVDSFEFEKFDETFDLTVGHPSGEGNFVANGIVVHNCGKTTYLADQVQKRVAKWCEDTGNHSMQCNDVLLASLTRTAAAEIRSRGLAIPSEQVGTLHAHALRALGKPKLCVSPKTIAEWNRESPMEFWRSEGASAMSEDGISLGRYNGDALFSEYTTNRCRLTPREEWRGPVSEFAKAYESWKYRNDYMDYDDLIIRAYEDNTDPPGNPSTILGDEQQDSSAAEFRLMRHWATKINKLILVGDADQSIFQFRGGDPDGMFASEIPEEHEKVLEQSYRVPRAVHAEAMRVIERVSRRKQVVYHPRDEDGEVERTCWSMRTAPYEAVDYISRLLDEPDERPGTPKAMCIFSCAYQANALMAALRSAGIPYWNPYARERGNFNPLHPAKGVSTLDRILDYLRSSEAVHGDGASVWTWEQFQNWTELCSSDGWLRHGAKAEVKRRAAATPTAVMKVDEIQALISHDDVLDDLAECSLEWLGQHIAETKKGVYSYVLDIAKRRGWLEVKSNPRVVVGTGHSIKGAEAENVFVCPDLSVSGWENYGDRDGRDSIFRLYYVALTRARRRLILTSPSCPQAVDL